MINRNMNFCESKFWFLNLVMLNNLFVKLKKPDYFVKVMTSGRPKKVQLCDYLVG